MNCHSSETTSELSKIHATHRLIKMKSKQKVFFYKDASKLAHQEIPYIKNTIAILSDIIYVIYVWLIYLQ